MNKYIREAGSWYTVYYKFWTIYLVCEKTDSYFNLEQITIGEKFPSAFSKSVNVCLWHQQHISNSLQSFLYMHVYWLRKHDRLTVSYIEAEICFINLVWQSAMITFTITRLGRIKSKAGRPPIEPISNKNGNSENENTAISWWYMVL